MIRVVLRMIPLLAVAAFAFGVSLADGPRDRAREIARLDAREHALSQRVQACANPPRNQQELTCVGEYTNKSAPGTLSKR